MTKDIAIAHRHAGTYGGSERVADMMANHFDTRVYSAIHDLDDDETLAPWTKLYDDSYVMTYLRHGRNWEGLIKHFWWQAYWQEVPELRQYDTLIESINGYSYYIPPEDQTYIRYVHSPLRRVYDLFENVDSVINRLYYAHKRRTLLESVPYPDLYIANSDVVANRMNKYWGVKPDQIRVVYPPVDVTNHTPAAAQTSDYYLALSRLAPNKNHDQIIEAFAQLDETLVIAGDGFRRDDLERLAEPHDNIRLVGEVSKNEKRELFAGAKATVFAAESEDFGIVPIESIASGTPVIGVNEGMTTHQISVGDTGYLWDRGVDNLRSAIERFEADGVAWSEQELADWAGQFSQARFFDELEAAIEEANRRAVPDPGLYNRRDDEDTPAGGDLVEVGSRSEPNW